MNSDYFDIFIEHLQSTFLIPLGEEVTLSTMRFLNPDELFMLAHIVAMAAIILGGLFNCWLGGFFARYRGAFHGMSEDDYMFFSQMMQKYGLFAVIFWWMPVGTILPFIAGFFKVRWDYIALLIALGYGIKFIAE